MRSSERTWLKFWLPHVKSIDICIPYLDLCHQVCSLCSWSTFQGLCFESLSWLFGPLEVHCRWSWWCSRCSWSGPSSPTSKSASPNATMASETPAESIFHTITITITAHFWIQSPPDMVTIKFKSELQSTGRLRDSKWKKNFSRILVGAMRTG